MTMKNTIHNFEKVYDQTITRIENSTEFSEKNKSLVKKFISQFWLKLVAYLSSLD
jgi:hypothetical protein